MGVSGLKTFVFENSKQLLKSIKLRKTPLIIDGNGICHKLFNNLKSISDYFGGNYDEFEKLCEHFFTELSDCDIEPHVFFDGVQDPSKVETTFNRLKRRIELQQQISEGKQIEENDRMLPMLAYETFKSVLLKRDIRHETCAWESDPQMAIFAKKLDCPILTCDSDFFIYDIPKCVVVDKIDLTKFKKCEEKEGNYLEVEMYHISDMISQLGPDAKNHTWIALLATVLGNDRIMCFRQFLKEAKLPVRCNTLRDISESKKVIKALGWLKSKQTLDEAIDELKSYDKPEQRESVERIRMSIEVYTNLASQTERNSSNWFTSINLPKWFEKRYRKCQIPVPALAAIIERPVILPSQVSAMSKPSPFQCCLSARKFMYRLLFESGTKHTVTEFDRDENCQLKDYCVCLDSLANDGKSIPFLNEIPTLSEEDRFAILLKNLDLPLKLTKQFPKNVCLLIAAIMLWLRNVDLEVDKNRYLYSLLACFIRSGKFDSCLNVPGVVNSRSLYTIQERYFELPSEINPTTFDCNVVHVFSQFQCCLQTVINLSQILCLSENAIHLVTGFNGTFLHNFYREITELDPEPFMQNIFGKDSKLFQIFNEIGQGL